MEGHPKQLQRKASESAPIVQERARPSQREGSTPDRVTSDGMMQRARQYALSDAGTREVDLRAAQDRSTAGSDAAAAGASSSRLGSNRGRRDLRACHGSGPCTPYSVVLERTWRCFRKGTTEHGRRRRRGSRHCQSVQSRSGVLGLERGWGLCQREPLHARGSDEERSERRKQQALLCFEENAARYFRLCLGLSLFANRATRPRASQHARRASHAASDRVPLLLEVDRQSPSLYDRSEPRATLPTLSLHLFRAEDGRCVPPASRASC